MRFCLQEVFDLHVIASSGVAHTITDEIWVSLKSALLKTTVEVCGTTKPHQWQKVVVE